MFIPEWFASQLRSEFGGRFSIRWSHARQAYILDEKVARGIEGTARVHAKLKILDRHLPDQAEELRHRLRAGTATFVEIAPGNRIACPKCGATVRLRFEEWEYAHCACGKDFKAIYAPLGWWLLERLRFLDFERGGEERVIAAMDQANAAKEATDVRDDRNVLSSAAIDDFNRIMQIQSVGYTGRERAWDGPLATQAVQ